MNPRRHLLNAGEALSTLGGVSRVVWRCRVLKSSGILAGGGEDDGTPRDRAEHRSFGHPPPPVLGLSCQLGWPHGFPPCCACPRPHDKSQRLFSTFIKKQPRRECSGRFWAALHRGTGQFRSRTSQSQGWERDQGFRGPRRADHLPTESKMMRFCSARSLWLCVRASSSRVRSRWKVRSMDRGGSSRRGRLPAVPDLHCAGPARRGKSSASSKRSARAPPPWLRVPGLHCRFGSWTRVSASGLHWLLPGRSCARSSSATSSATHPLCLMMPPDLDTQGQHRVRCAWGSRRWSDPHPAHVRCHDRCRNPPVTAQGPQLPTSTSRCASPVPPLSPSLPPGGSWWVG
jgi:hypothetical protein